MKLRKKSIFIIVLIIVMIIGIFTNGFGLFVGVEGQVEIPLSEITETARFYDYNSGDTRISFFAVKASGGTIKTGFDACDVCYDREKGYSQQGEFMICNNCGNRYPITGLGTENKNPGGCWPGYLASSIDEETGNLIIKNSDIEKGKWRFK